MEEGWHGGAGDPSMADSAAQGHVPLLLAFSLMLPQEI